MMKAKRCPCCGRPFGPVRFCRKCKQVISPGHKYHRVKGGLEHRCCRWPQSYLGPEWYRREHGEAAFRRMAPVLFRGLHTPALKVKQANEKGLTRKR